MTSINDSAFPIQADIRVRQADLGLEGSVNTIGMARWLEDARLRARLPRFERLVSAGEFGPFRIILVSQGVERLASVSRTDADIRVHTGIRRIGRSSFTYEHAVSVGGNRVGRGEATVLLHGPAKPLSLPEELVADLAELRIPESSQEVMARPDADRHRRDHYARFIPLRARIGDVDSNRHVNFIAIASWYDEAVAVSALGGIEVGEGGLTADLLPWSYRIQYVGEVTYPGDYGIGIRVRSFGADSLRYELGIFSGETCLGLADAIGGRGELSAKSVEDSR
ncbi:hypothetical protein AB0E08_17650 [Streptomyces sp. NPDC048281]|uniref:acyl-CoA thioesterase n=1 Tax=Streptomyces sp. NPDC048281 TaxID=3154715 RepID=UPI00341D3AFE